jgi:amino acid transporter
MARQGNGWAAARPKRRLSLFDSTSLIVGIIIGVGIYETSPLVASCVPSVGWLAAVWAAGGLVSLVGALAYAELATAWPEEGGDYVYLTRAFGRRAGFLFAWAQFWVVRPGSIGAMAYVFARYANRLWPLGDGAAALITYAGGSILVLTAINLLGVRSGKTTQNLLTVLKVLGLGAIVAVGMAFGQGGGAPAAGDGGGGGDLRLAFILILYTYGGWNEMAYVAAEVRRPRRNILRALVAGTVAVTAIYVLVNLAFVQGLGLEGVRTSKAAAADVLALGLGEWAARAMCVLVCVSALGAVNGQIFTGARIYYAMGRDHRLYAPLGRWNARLGTPAWSLLAQAAVTLALVAGFGFTRSGFESLVKFTTPVFWFFFLLVGVSLFVLRRREPARPRPYRVPGYPWVPALFCASSLFMLYASLSYAIENRTYEALWAVGLMAAGVALSGAGAPSVPAGEGGGGRP